jgi:DnaJ-domain-containing protein 1
MGGFFQFLYVLMQMAQAFQMMKDRGLFEEDPVLREANWRRFEEELRQGSRASTFSKNKDFYAILGVKRDATPDEIKQAFRTEIKTCHPDLFPDDAEKADRSKELIEAYDVLSDPDKRASFDRWSSV